MPVRSSSFTKRIASNGAKLHKARMERTHAQGAADAPSAEEQALAEERRLLKEERAKRKAKALLPGPTALDKLVRTHHPEGKGKPKPAKEGKEPKSAKGGKHGPTRAQKHEAKAAALDAARRAKTKSAKT